MDSESALGADGGSGDLKLATIWRVIWPDRGPLFAIVGGIVSLLGDFAQFLANIASPQLLIWPIVALAGLLAWFCFGRIGKGASASGADIDHDVLHCRECDSFRVLLFAGLGAGLLLLAGQGTTATERIGAQLGLIQADVSAIREDTAALRDITSSVEIDRNPRSAEAYFRNAWIYANVRRDNAAAWESVQALYERFAPNRLDAAELYFNAGRATLTRDALLARMIETGQRKRDASMLVIAGRNASSNEEAQALYAEARAIDPELPFAYWDVARIQLIALQPGATPRENLAHTQAIVAGHEQFLEIAARKPVASYFYLPQHQADFETVARSQLDSFRGGLANWQRAVEQQDQIDRMRRR